MKHARSDYDERIQDSAGLIPDSEPVLLIRGQDILAPLMLDLYIGHYAVTIPDDGGEAAGLQHHHPGRVIGGLV